MAVEVRDNIYSDIASQFPAVYQENGEVLLAFIEAYYKHLDETIDRDIPRLRDIDTTLTAFLIYYKNKYMAGLPLEVNPPIDIRFIVKHIKNLYTRKGSQESLELMFKLFFDEDISVVYPGNRILKTSDSVWGNEEFLEMTSVYDVADYPLTRGNTITGDLSKASAFVDDIVFVSFKGALTPIVYLSNLKGTFSRDDALEVTSYSGDTDTTINVGKLIAGSLSSVSVNKQSRLPTQQVGDTVDIVSTNAGVGAKGVVTKVSTDAIGSVEYEVIDGGFGYILPDSITVENQEFGVSNQVITLPEDGYISVKPGDTIVFPGSTVSYEDHDVYENGKPKEQFSVNGSAVVIKYVHPFLYIRSKQDKHGVFDIMGEVSSSSPLRSLALDAFVHARADTQNNFTASATILPVGLKFSQIVRLSPDFAQGILGNFTGINHDGDLSTIGQDIDVEDMSIIAHYLLAINNGIDDGLEDEDGAWLRTGATSTAPYTPFVYKNDAARVYPSSPEVRDVADRTPTIQPVPTINYQTMVIAPSSLATDVGVEKSDFTVSLGDLKHGQVYTIIHSGTNFPAEDWVKIGARYGIPGEDFIFSSARLSELTTNVIQFDNQQELLLSSLNNFDALFSSIKQIYGRLYNYLGYNDVFPKITIGSSYGTPEGDDYTHRDVTHVSVHDLVAGETYIVSDFGNLTHTEWTAMGLDLDNLTEHTVLAPNLLPARTYMIQDLVNTPFDDWRDVGVPAEAVIEKGLVFQTRPDLTAGVASGIGEVIDITGLNHSVETFFTAADPVPTLPNTKNAMCVNRTTTRADVATRMHGACGLFVDPLVSGGSEQRTLPSSLFNKSPEFFGYINGDPSRRVACNRLGQLNESSTLEVSSLANTERVSIIRDTIGDYFLEEIGDATSPGATRFLDHSYEMSGTVNDVENIDTPIGEAFEIINMDIGTIENVVTTSPGLNYENDTHVYPVNKDIVKFDKKDLIVNFSTSDFVLEPGETITQNIVLPSEALDAVNDLSADDVAALASSISTDTTITPYGDSQTIFSIQNAEYTVKYRFLKQEGRDYYFRPLSFNGFDKSIPVPIRSVDRTIVTTRQDPDSKPMGANAEIVGNASYSTGQIEEIKILHTGYKYSNNETVNIVNTNPSRDNYNDIIATAKVQSFGMGNTDGKWKTKSSFLGHDSGQRLHDNDYYQEYSYDIASLIDPEVYEPLIKDVVGVAGTKMFSTPLINSVNKLDASVDIVIQTFDVTTETLLAQGFHEVSNVAVGDGTDPVDAEAITKSGQILIDPLLGNAAVLFNNVAVGDTIKVTETESAIDSGIFSDLYYTVTDKQVGHGWIRIGTFPLPATAIDNFTSSDSINRDVTGYTFEKVVIENMDTSNVAFETNPGSVVRETTNSSTVTTASSILLNSVLGLNVGDIVTGANIGALTVITNILPTQNAIAISVPISSLPPNTALTFTPVSEILQVSTVTETGNLIT